MTDTELLASKLAILAGVKIVPSCVREPIIRLRIRCSACRSCCSMDLFGFVGHEAHVRTAHRLADRFRIIGIVFLRLQIGLDELRSDQPHLVSESSQHATTVMSTFCGFDANQARTSLPEKFGDLTKLSLVGRGPSLQIKRSSTASAKAFAGTIVARTTGATCRSERLLAAQHGRMEIAAVLKVPIGCRQACS